MKNLVKIFSVLMMIVGTFAFGQSKEISPTDLNFVKPTVSTSKLIIDIHIEWGRKSKGCRGFGICGAKITIEWGEASLSENFEKSGYKTDYVALLEFTNEVPKEYDTTLKIDEDVYIGDYRGKKLYVPAGEYKMRDDLSKNHNYVLPVKNH